MAKSEEKIKTKTPKKINDKEYSEKITDLAKSGLTSEKIGEKLRREGIHPQDYNKKISEILREAKIYVDPSLKNVEKKLEGIKKHFSKNKQDKRSMREKDRLVSQLRRINAYNNRKTE